MLSSKFNFTNAPSNSKVSGQSKIIKVMVKFEAEDFEKIYQASLSQYQVVSYSYLFLFFKRTKIEQLIKTKTQNKQYLRYFKDEKKFIPFSKQKFEEKDKDKYKNIFEKDLIIVQYKYKNKKDELLKSIYYFQKNVQERHRFLMGISNQCQDISKPAMLKRMASTMSGLQKDSSQISIILLISDPLIRNKQIKQNKTTKLVNKVQRVSVGHEEIDLEGHLKILRQASDNSPRSLTIAVNKNYAAQSQINNVFSQKKESIKIVHFFTYVVRCNEDLYLAFQGKKQNIGEEKLIKLSDFFARPDVLQSKIDLLIFAGYNAYLIKQYIPESLNFPIILFTTSNVNDQQDSFHFLLKSFYQNLFKRKQIEQSFNLLVQQFNRKVLNDKSKFKKALFCCCHHNHSQNCGWNKIIEKAGISLAHKLFYHTKLKQTPYSIYLNYDIQKYICSQLDEDKLLAQCVSKQRICCQQAHDQKGKISDKYIFISNKNTKILFKVNNDLSVGYAKNNFNQQFISQKLTKQRRYPLILFQLVRKIVLNRGKIIQFVGNKRIGKSQFIQSAQRYIKNRKNNYIFESVDLNQGSMQACVGYMFKRADKLGHSKRVVFVHHNNSNEIQKQYLQIFNKNRNKDHTILPFTYLIKVVSLQEQKYLQNSTLNTSLQQKNLTVVLPRLDQLDIFLEFRFMLAKQDVFQDINHINKVITFAKNNHKKMTNRGIKLFLKYFEQNIANKYQPSYDKVLEKMSDQLNKKMMQTQKQNQQLFDFVGFMSQFPEGFYLTKLNTIILKIAFGIEDINSIVKVNEYANYYFEVVSKIAVKYANTVTQKIDFIFPDDKVIDFFKRHPELKKKYQKMKYIFFYYFFMVLETLIFQNINISRKKFRKQRNIIEEGIFLFNSITRPKSAVEQHAEINKIIKAIQIKYSNQVDYKSLFESFQSQKSFFSQMNENIKQKILKEKILNIIFLESQRYVLYRHMTNIVNFLFHHEKKNENQDIKPKQQANQNLQKDKKFNLIKKCPIIFYKRIILIYRLVLKQKQKYEQLYQKMMMICPNMIEYYQKRGQSILQELNLKNNNFHENQQNLNRTQTSIILDPQIKKKSLERSLYAKSQTYFVNLISFIQIYILLRKKNSFSLTFGQFGQTRKSMNQFNNSKLNQKKKGFVEQLLKLLPKIKKQIKMQTANEFSPQKSKSQKQNVTKLNLKSLNNTELIMILLTKLLYYECEEQYINYSNDIQIILIMIQTQIELFSDIMLVQQEIERRNLKQNYIFLETVGKEQYLMQILRLYMRKIQLHFKLKHQEKRVFQNKKIQNKIDLVRIQEPFQTFQTELKRSFEDPINQYYQDQKVGLFLKNIQICKRYILLVRENDKVTEQFTTSMRQIQIDYKEIYNYLCVKACKKKLFNQTNNIIFFKSRVMIFQDKPHTWIRKRNVTMRYINKLLNNVKLNITFLHLTKSNFDYIQIDRIKSPNCKIKYLILTVDCFINKKQEIFILFQKDSNISQQRVKLQQFLIMMNTVNVQFIIIMGSKATLLSENLHRKMKNPPVILGFQNPKYSLANFIQYKDPEVIDQIDQFMNSSSQTFIDKIYEYVNIQCYHCMLDLILCTLITDLVLISQTSKKYQKNPLSETQKQVICTEEKIEQIVTKAIKLAKQIMEEKWFDAKKIVIDYNILIFKNQPEAPESIKKIQSSPIDDNYLSVEKQISFANKLSSRDSYQLTKYFPYFQKGSIIDNTPKLYQSPDNLEDQPYYENVDRVEELTAIMDFIHQSNNKVVEIYGCKGTGKTSFLNQICWMNHTYRLFKDGVYYFDLKKLQQSSQTLIQHIQIVRKQDKIIAMFDENSTFDQKYNVSTILVALDNLDVNSIKQNYRFFQKLRERPICLIYSTIHQNMQKQLQNYLTIDHPLHCIHLRQIMRKKSSNDSGTKLFQQYLKVKELIPRTNSTKSHDSKQHKSMDNSSSSHHQSLQGRSSTNFNEEIWSLLKIDINHVENSALFCIALSYLKKEELGSLTVDLKQFIKTTFSKEVLSIMKQFKQQQLASQASKLNSLKQKKLSQRNSLHPNETDTLSLGNVELHRAKSSMQKMNQGKNGKPVELGKISRLINHMNQFFKRPNQQNEQSQKIIPQIRISEILNNNTGGLFTGKNRSGLLFANKNNLKDNNSQSNLNNRLWFYEDSFEELMIRSERYDRLKILFK